MDTVCGVSVERGADGTHVVTWDERFSTAPVSIAAADTPVATAAAPDRVTGAHAPVTLALDPAQPRWYLRLTPQGGAPLVVAERGVPLAGGVNFRDLGGYRAADGRRVRWGRLFRSGHMANLDAADKRVFAALGITTVCDFRLAEESASEHTDLPGPPALHILGIPPGVGDKEFFHRLFASSTDPQDVVDAMHVMLRCLVREAAPFYARLFEVLLADPPGAVLLNCSAGKERTGIGSALVLSALGVPRETIMYDFMLSGRYFPAAAEVPRVREKYAVSAPGELGRALIMPLLETRASYLEAAFAAIDEDFGSTEAFLAENYALGAAALARLREHYTE